MLGFYPIAGDAISSEGQGAAATTAGLGGFLLGGPASQSSTVNTVSTGGFILGGTAPQTATVNTTSTGGFILGGHASQSSTTNAVSAGGFLLGGSSVMASVPASTQTSSITGAAGFLLGGTAALNSVSVQVATTTGQSGFILGGPASQSATVDTASTGGFILGGSAVMSTTGSGTWTAQSNLPAHTTCCLTFQNGLYYIATCGPSQAYYLYSSNLTTWTATLLSFIGNTVLGLSNGSAIIMGYNESFGACVTAPLPASPIITTQPTAVFSAAVQTGNSSFTAFVQGATLAYQVYYGESPTITLTGPAGYYVRVK